MPLDYTHDPARRSWVSSAQAAHTDFPLQNLPYGRFRRRGVAEHARVGVAIGDAVLDLAALSAQLGAGEALPDTLPILAAGDLNGFMARGPAAWQAMRVALFKGLAEGSAWQALFAPCLVPQAEAEMVRPFDVGDYTDFYTGIHHATAVGKLFRPDQPLLPNYRWVPIGYHGRASSVQVSPQAFRRPKGQQAPLPAAQPNTTGSDPGVPRFGPTQRLDHELELGAVVGTANALGEPVPIEQAEAALFGLVLLNDWSARDVQAWEYQPLGPFHAKNFATTISPWVVTMAALEPFRAPFRRPAGDPQPLPYLTHPSQAERGAVDIALSVWLQTPAMRTAGQAPVQLMQSNTQDAYWTLAQLVAHHTVGGCNLNPGDLLGSGTLSGPEPGQGGSLLELTQGGKLPVTLPNGETRLFLQDGDTVTLRGRCERNGIRAIGFGACAGTVLPTA
jgi:fumarylacetoacetase